MLAVIVAIAILAFVFLPNSEQGTKGRRTRAKCLSNLKQVGLGFIIWETDNESVYPWEVSTNKGGTMEFVASGETFRHFQIVSNLSDPPKILVCPDDRERNYPTDWNDLINANLSYFAGLTAESRQQQSQNPFIAVSYENSEILSGDRQITGGSLTNHVLTLLPNTPAGWPKNVHGGAGNIGLADGSVSQTTAKQLQARLQKRAETRLAMP